MPVGRVDVAGTIAGLDALVSRVNDATSAIVADAAHLYQLAGIANAPVGTPGNSTNPPGDLARSIDVQGPRGGDGIYEAEVGPTVIYGRQRELGGEIFVKHARALHFFRFEEEIFTHHVHQFGAHYMLRSYDEVTPDLWPLAVKRIEEAIVGS